MVMHYLTALSTLSEFLPVAIFMTPGSVSAPNSRQQGNEDTGKSNNLFASSESREKRPKPSETGY